MAVYVATSEDGVTWTELTRLTEDMLGGPPHLMQMSNGVVVLTYGYRESLCGTRARLSYDGGVTWGKEIILAVSASSNNTDCGYPSTVEIEPGVLISAYYQPYSRQDIIQNDKGELNGSLMYTKWMLTETK